MQTSDIIKNVAQKIQRWDYTNTQVFTDKEVREADILEAINYVYRGRVFPEWVKESRETFEQTGTEDTWNATGTVSATSTGSTLVASTSIFTSNMVDGIVYNSTDGETRKITAYTSATTVTVDDDIDDDWDGDTIYVFTGIFTFGGDASDIYQYPAWVGIKYNSTDKDYTRCTPYGSSAAYRTRKGRSKDQSFLETEPIYTKTSVSISDVSTPAIKIRPIPDTPISDGIYMEYTRIPPALVNDTDTPELPDGHHEMLIHGAVAEICYGHLNDPTKGDKFEVKFRDGLATLLDSLTSSDEVEPVDDRDVRVDFNSRRR